MGKEMWKGHMRNGQDPNEDFFEINTYIYTQD